MMLRYDCFMGIEEPIVGGVSKSAGFLASPVGKINVAVTSILLIILVIVGISESVEQHSLYPIFDRTFVKIISADNQISHDIDDLESSARPVRPSSIISSSFPVWLWFWCVFWFQIISSIWFIWFVGWIIYNLFNSLNAVSSARNLVLTIFSYLIISMFTGLLLFNMSLAGLTMPSSRMQIFNLELMNSYPLHGVVKLVSHFYSRDLFTRVADWATDNGFGRMVSNIPSSLNISNTSVNLSGGVYG